MPRREGVPVPRGFKWAKKRTHCKHGHEFDETNTYFQEKARGGGPMRTCRKCQADRMQAHRDAIGHDVVAAKMREWRESNRERDRKNWRELRLTKKRWLDAQKVKCSRCDETHIACLEFHHRDPKAKVIVLALAVARHSLARIQAEVAKCDIICSNCHRKLHWQERHPNGQPV